MSRPEMPIFTRSFDLLTWLLPVTNHFPKAHRHSFTQRMLDAAFDLRERLEEANLRRAGARLERLALADEALARQQSVAHSTDRLVHDFLRLILSNTSMGRIRSDGGHPDEPFAARRPDGTGLLALAILFAFAGVFGRDRSNNCVLAQLFS